MTRKPAAATKKALTANQAEIRSHMSNLIREELFEGKKHFVVPVILMVEGVHNGIFYSAEELGKFPDAWNGEPIPVYHPKQDGKPVSANSPKVI